MKSAEMQPGTVIDERFVLSELAGTGGMGQVYRALDRRTGADVAVKLVHATGDTQVQRFLREARLLAKLEHPGIVRYVAHGDSPTLYLAMEWLDGEDLGRRLGRMPLGLRECLELARRVAEALDAAHRQGVVHRDIKPSNIFLCDRSIDRVKLLDFGVARLLQGTRAVTMTGQVLGTIGYMAPEQARDNHEVRSTVDVFSLGCVLFESLTGRPAFPGERLMEVMAKILFAEVPRVSDLREGLPPLLDDIVHRMMRKRPDERPTLPTIVAELETIAAMPTLEELRLRPRSAKHEDAAISGDEQRLISVVLADEGLSGKLKDTSPTLSISTVRRAAQAIAEVAEPFGGHVELLANGWPLVVLASSGAASDLAARAARCALALRSLVPTASMAVAMGRGDPSKEARLGEVVARAEMLFELTKKVREPRVERSGARGREEPGGLGGVPPQLDRERPRGTLRIDHVTAGLLDARFELAGDADSLELIGERDRGEPSRKLLGKPMPFVGRNRELAMLDAALEECFGEPVASAFVVTAPAGAGKSRLVHELLRTIASTERSAAERGVAIKRGVSGGLPPRMIEERGGGARVQVWRARADPLAAGEAFAMVSELLHGMAGLADGEAPEVRRQKLAARIARHLPEAPKVAEFLGELVAADFPDDTRPALRTAREDAALLGENLMRAWEELVVAECSAGPLLIVLEDMQWGDLPSVRFMDAALRAARARPLMVLALGRPEVDEIFVDLWKERRTQQLRLAELTPRAAKQLVTEALGESADERTTEVLIERAGGNPLYLEELIRAVAEGRGDALPETVLAMAQTRLERLAPDARRVLRAASVFGQVFWVGGIAALLGTEHRDEVLATLTDLVNREFITRHSASRFVGEEEFAFRHLLVRDAAYRMLTERDRKRGHRLAGAWLEATGERHAIVMAEHLERGGEPGSAVVWYLWAAEQALEGNDLSSVVARAERGIACGASGAVLGELRLLQAEALGWGAHSDEHLRLAREALSLLSRGSGAYARAAAELAVASARLGDLDQLRAAAASLREGDARLEAATITVAHVVAIARTVIELLVMGKSAWAEKLIGTLDALGATDEEDGSILEAIREWLRAASALYEGDPEIYVREGEAILSAVERCGQQRCAVIVSLQIGMALAAIGDDESAHRWLAQTVVRAERIGITAYAEHARAQMALPLARLGRRDEAIEAVNTALAAARAGKDAVTEARASASLAALLLAAGDHDGAEREARAVVGQETFPTDSRADASATLAGALVQRGRCAEAIGIAERGIALAREGSVGGDALLRLALIDALTGEGLTERAERARAAALKALDVRARAIRDERRRAAFLELPEHAATRERAARSV